ncbi:hypothetical protein [Sphingomonas sp.]|jgi:hypothetical protein|uniref:hypothetical protein n=1 Tax=Sphingomonas sp. TaxID=28214 RepID=UPI002ED8EF71
MKFGKYMAIAAAASLSAAPALAAPANPAASLSVAKSVRAKAPSARANKLGGGAGGIVALLIGAGIASILIVDATKNDDSDSN